MTTAAEHGTYARYNAEMASGEKPCDLCRKAANIYIREWRAKSPRHQVEKARERARGKARRALAFRHRAEFLRLVDQFMASDESA